VSDDRPQTIDVRLPEALTAVRIRGRVVDERGAAVGNARVALYDDDDPHALVSWKAEVAQAISDQTGLFSLTGFSGRRYHVQATMPLGGGRSEMVPVAMQTPTPSVTVTMPQRSP
jgi:Carboxypeptidase regulatory-like domain